MRPRTLVVLALAVGSLAACGDDDESAPAATEEVATSTTSSATGTAGDDAFCDPMEELANFNAATPAPQPSEDLDELKETFAELYDEAVALYDEPIANAPEDIAGDLELLRDVSSDFLADIQAASTPEDILDAAEAVNTPELTEATQRVDEYIREECGFGLTEGN